MIHLFIATFFFVVLWMTCILIIRTIYEHDAAVRNINTRTVNVIINDYKLHDRNGIAMVRLYNYELPVIDENCKFSSIIFNNIGHTLSITLETKIYGSFFIQPEYHITHIDVQWLHHDSGYWDKYSQK